MNQKKLLGVLISVSLVTITIILVMQKQKTDHFNIWKSEFNPTWSQGEETYRKIIFYKNIQEINRHNANTTQTYQMGINQFTAYTKAEFKLIFLKQKQSNTLFQNINLSIPKLNPIDWTTKGLVSPVKYQGNCGSCWAFSAVGALESFFLMKGQTVDLSEQQLVDCSSDYGNDGCDGGHNYQALYYVNNYGITTTLSYPYVAKDQSCKTNGGSFKINDVEDTSGCQNIANALQLRPIAVGVDAQNWQKYASGIFNNCGTDIDHDVLLVGATDQYWKIKNSWSTRWGENGFIRIAQGNTCGMCQNKSPWPV